jgi:diketogulonate reductase-like aldo/keto reductase
MLGQSGARSSLAGHWGGLFARRNVERGPTWRWGEVLRRTGVGTQPARWWGIVPSAEPSGRMVPPPQTIGPSVYSVNMTELVSIFASGVEMPRLFFGPAKTSARIEDLVVNASRAGIRGFDIGEKNAKIELGVGKALQVLFAEGVERDKLFIQSKVNPKYNKDIAADVDKQVLESLENLGVEYVDTLVLATPGQDHAQTMEAWRAMETAVGAGLAKQLGIANIGFSGLKSLYEYANVKPIVVQERLLYENRFQRSMRTFCIEKGMYVQPYSTVEDNAGILEEKVYRKMATQYDVTTDVLWLRLMQGLRMMPITSSSEFEKLEQESVAWKILLEGQDAWNINLSLIRLIEKFDKEAR